MPIFRWTPRGMGHRQPWREMERFRSQVENVFNSLADAVESRIQGGTGVYPLINLYEDDERLYLTAELPGISPDEVDLSVKSESVTIRGERKIREEDKLVNYHRRERDSGFFRRTINLPTRVDPEKAQAKAWNGLLRIVLPKAEEEKTRKISVQGT